MDKEKTNKFDELYRIIDISAKARYRASSRLSNHGIYSQWTLSLLAIGLIIVSVLDLSSIQLNFQAPYTDVMQIIFSIMILTYSLLLGMGNYNSRSEKILRCGMELSRVLRKVKPYKGKNDEADESTYDELSRSYYDCLDKYENHKDVDFLTARLSIERRKGFPEKTPDESKLNFIYRLSMSIYSRIMMLGSITIRTILSFFHYPAALIAVYTWIIFLVI